MSARRPAIFLDRDGTLSHEVGYVNHPSRFRLYPWSVDAVRAINDAGQLANPIFLDITARLQPFLLLRVVGGSMYLIGAIMMGINFWKTIRGSDETAQEPVSATV